MADEQTIFRLEGVAKGFGSGVARVDPLQGVDFTVRRGETLVLIGPSGTGKSVTLRLMLGLLAPDAGHVFFEGGDIAGFNDQQLDAMRGRLSMLFQSGALFDSMTVGENVGFPLRARGERDDARIDLLVERSLAAVGLAGTADKMPSELSGGMRKRAALARAIAPEPEMIFYDEPTTGLDPVMSDAIADLINAMRQLLSGRFAITSVVVTHDMNVACKTADRILMLYGGKLVGEGPPEYFRRLGETPRDRIDNEREELIRQFVRGEAEGPIGRDLARPAVPSAAPRTPPPNAGQPEKICGKKLVPADRNR